MSRRLLELLVAVGLISAALPGAAADSASDLAAYPTRTITIVVPYSAGGSTDALARILGKKLASAFDQSVIVENRPGAGSNIGVGYVARSAPDGYIIGLTTSTALSINPNLYKNLPFDAEASFEPIFLAAFLPSVVVVNNALPVSSIQELNAYLRKPTTRASFASAGAGTAPHLGAELYRAGVGFDAVHIPYKGGAPALTGLVGGETTFMIAVTPEAMPLVKGGKLKALAVSTRHRLKEYPDLPTISESAVPGYEMVWGYGFIAPRGTSKSVISKLNAAFNRAMEDPEVANQLKRMGYELAGGDPSRLGDMLRNDRAKWKAIINKLGMTAD